MSSRHAPFVGSKEAAARATKARSDKSVERKEKFLIEFKASDCNLQIALACVPIAEGTYYKWRQRDPVFAAKVDAARLGTETRFDRTHAAALGFAQFRKDYFSFDSTWFHLRIVEALEHGDPGSITLILLPPEHGKTTTLEDYCNYKLAQDPSFRITYCSEKQDHSKKALRRVRGRMEPGGPARKYVATFGPFAPQRGGNRSDGVQPWGATQFDVLKKGDHDERDYSMVALGFGAAVAGTRTDLLIVDDVQSLKSLNMTDKIFAEFRQDWLSRPGEFGRTVIIGTRVGEDDFYQKLLDEDLIDNLICLPAINDDGEYLWPERYTPQMYANMRRKAGESAWWRNYMQQPQADGELAYTDEIINPCKNGDRSVNDPPPDGSIIYFGLDPSLGNKNVLIACALHDRKLKVLRIQEDSGLVRYSQIAARIEEMIQWMRHNGECAVTDIVIETMAFQSGLATDERILEIVEKYGVRIREHLTGINKYDPDIGVASMATSFLRKEVELPYAKDVQTRAQIDPLIAQLKAWKPNAKGLVGRGNKKRQDRVMALWFVWILWRMRRKQAEASTEQFRQQGLPWKPTPNPLAALRAPVSTGRR